MVDGFRVSECASGPKAVAKLFSLLAQIRMVGKSAKPGAKPRHVTYFLSCM